MSCWRVIRAVCLSAFCAPAIALAGEPGADQGPLSENERSPTLLASDSELPPGPLSFAPSLGFTTFNGHPAYNVGGRGVLLLDEHFGLGFAVYAAGWAGPRGDNRALSDERRLRGGYGGVLFEYRPVLDAVVHPLFDTTIGGGSVCLEESEHRCEYARGFQLVEPTANVEIGLARFVRVALGGGYRFAFAGTRASGLDLGGVVLRTSLGLGWF